MRLDVSQKPTHEVSELTLRRFRAGELTPDDQAHVETQIANDAHLRAQMKAIAEEQAKFETDISFERFAGGVARAQRDLARKRVSWKLPALSASTMAFAAAAVFLLLARPTTAPQGGLVSTHVGVGANRTKGSNAEIVAIVRVASARGEQNTALPGKLFELHPGDRVRLGIHLRDSSEFVAAISTDEAGATTPVYPESGEALRVVATKEPTYLPDSFEFTGKGRETLYVLVAPAAFDVNAASQALGTYIAATKALDKLDAHALPKIPGLKLISFPFNKP